MKLISTLTNQDLKTKVYRDTENDVYLVRFFKEGKENVNGSYETDDLNDALGTARNMCGIPQPD